MTADETTRLIQQLNDVATGIRQAGPAVLTDALHLVAKVAVRQAKRRVAELTFQIEACESQGKTMAARDRRNVAESLVHQLKLLDECSAGPAPGNDEREHLELVARRLSRTIQLLHWDGDQ